MVKQKLISSFRMILFIALGLYLGTQAQTPVARYGQLKVTGNKITDQSGNAVQLRGMSLFWSNSLEGSPFYNANTVKWLRDDWCIDVIRIAMGVETLGGQAGYLNNASGEKAKVVAVIDACIANGIYCIVDFHTHNAEQSNQTSAAKTFFTEIATTYGNKANIMYETFNEPINQSWSTIKSYHDQLVTTIRAKDPDNIIICGTRNYSREVEEASLNKVTGTNIAYTVHFYAGGGADHNADLRAKVTNAMNNGAAIFCTEYGTCDPSGNGSYNTGNTQTWWTFMDNNKISSCDWSVCNKNETASILTPGTTSTGNWSSGQLTTSGTFVRNYIKSKCNSATGTLTITAPTTGASYAQAANVTFTATATISSGTIDSVVYYDGVNRIGKATASPYSVVTNKLTPGSHTIVAKSYSQGNLIVTSASVIVTVAGNTDISTTGAQDLFEKAPELTELSGGYNTTSCSGIATAASAGIYWFQDVDTATTKFKARKYRKGDGKLMWEISQAQNNYGAFGFNFGEYCNGTTKTKYALNLSGNATMKFTLAAPSSNTADLEVKIQMRDADGTVIAFSKDAVKAGTTTVDAANWWKYEIGYSKNHTGTNAADPKSLVKGTSVAFDFNFKNTLSIKNPNGPSYPADINNNNTDFDFSKVVEVVFIVVNAAVNNTTDYFPVAITNQQIIFSNFVLGDVNLGPNFCTTPPTPLSTASPVYCQGATPTALTATGTTGLDLVWYDTDATGGTASVAASVPSTSAVGTTSYYVAQKLPNSTCESARKAIAVTVNPSVTPTVQISTTSTSVNAGDLVTFTASSTNAGATPTYQWTKNGNAIPSATSSSYSTTTLSNNDVIGLELTSNASCANPTKVISNTLSMLVTGVEDVLFQNMEVYPNPAFNQVEVLGLNSGFTYELVDNTSRVVKSGVSNRVIDMSNLNNGSYMLIVNVSDKKKAIKVLKAE